MKKFVLNILGLLFFCPALLKAQVFTALYDFAAVNNTTGRIDPTPVPTANGVTFGSFTAVGNVSANPNASGRFSFTGWPLGATNGSNSFSGTINTGQYYEVKLEPQANYNVTLDSITFTLQRSGSGIRQYAIRSSIDGFASNLPAVIDPSNSNLEVVLNNVFQVSDATSGAENGSKIVLSGMSAFKQFTAPITIRFYAWNAEGSTGTFSLDNVKIFGSAEVTATGASIITSTAAINFASTTVNTFSEVKSYTVIGNNLSDPLHISTAAPFLVSTDSINYVFSLDIQAADAAIDKTIYVKFNPTTAGIFNGNITHTSTGAITKAIAVSGEGFDAANLVFNFNNCSTGGSPGQGFTAYSVSGSQTWACTNFGRNTTKGAEMNGFSGGVVDNEDWFISPALAISTLNLPVLRFYSRNEFTGPLLQLMVSTDYDGTGNPNNYNWTELTVNFPPPNNTWTLSDGIDLSAYKSAPNVYIAFKYVSSIEMGAARWTLDDIDITERTQLVSTSPVALNLGEAAVGTNSPGYPFIVKVAGYGNITVSVPVPFSLSTDSLNYSSSVIVPEASAASGIILFARFTPTSKILKIEGQVKITGTGLDTNKISVSGTSYPRAETFDAGTYNLSFFGSSPTNTTTQQKINTQVNNIAVVFNRLKQDVTGIQEVSNDVALDSLVKKIPHTKAILSHRYSFSYNPPDPNFPPQKIGFVYDTTVVKLVEARVMFENLYDSARTGFPNLLPGYPTGSPSGFWASGRLPFMATFDASINGVNKRIRMIVIHAKSATDASSYNRRVYDARVLKDTLDAMYPNDNIIIVGDYNDRLAASNYTGSPNSSYKPFIDDSADYTGLTLGLDQAGKSSYINGTSMIDHLIATHSLMNDYIPNSVEIEDPRNYVGGYNATSASDHLPVSARFSFNAVLPITLTQFNAQLVNKQVVLNWGTLNEVSNNYFNIERSANLVHFKSIDQIKSTGAGVNKYTTIDKSPLGGTSYYRLKQTDIDGRYTYSNVVVINIAEPVVTKFTIYPNPVDKEIQFNLPPSNESYTAQVHDVNGKVIITAYGNLNGITKQFNKQMDLVKRGIYFIKLTGAKENFTATFLKK